MTRRDDDLHDARYTALRARDRRFDGRFFVAVRTTGIYCRPVCRARLPLARNCTFHETAAAAEREGYRPCLRCRPELAPGRSITDAHARLAGAAYARIAAGALNGQPLAALARELCVSERQLRRAVGAEFGASPVELAQTQRLLLAKQLLTETELPMTRVAFASGFSSVSRFNALFLERYRMSPSRLRGEARTGGASGAVVLRFSYRPPFPWERMLAFLGRRAIAGVEVMDATSYARTLAIGDARGWFRVRHVASEHALAVEISDGLVPALLPLRAAVRRLFDLDAEPAVIAAHFEGDAVLGPVTRAIPGLRLPGCADPFEVAVRAVLGQQISVAAARTLAGRLTAAFGEALPGALTRMAPDAPDAPTHRAPDAPDAPTHRAPDALTHMVPRAERLADTAPEEIATLGMPLARARTLVVLAQAVRAGDVVLGNVADVPAAVAALRRLPGIGPWTAEYIALRGLHWPDAFPASDAGVRAALGGADVATVTRRAEAWRPWRGYAVIHLWESLSTERKD
jgi:AraC family transcriptional regulator, regulatory protein of adaptative response / DNA-3-methyladenine glycosylase II